MARYCSSCGTALPAGSAFCPECGIAIVQASPPASVESGGPVPHAPQEVWAPASPPGGYGWQPVPPGKPKKKLDFGGVMLGIAGGIALLFLLGWLVALLSEGGGPDNAASPPANSLVMDKTDRIILDEDRFYSLEYTAAYNHALTVDVRSEDGPLIDLLVLDVVNYQQFSEGASYLAYTECGASGIKTHTASCNLDPDTYYIVFDNSDRGGYQPPFNGSNDVAIVSFTARAQV